MIELKITDTPPTINSMFSNVYGKGRVKSKRYKQWCKSANIELRLQKPKKILTNKYGLIVYIRKRSNADLSNYMKPIEDLLVSMGITPDDKNNMLPIVMPYSGNGCKLIILDGNEVHELSNNITSQINDLK